MKAIYKLHLNFHRMGKIASIFVAEKDSVASAVGKEVYFGEVLGKHSEIFGVLEADDITEVTDDPEAVALFEKYDLSTGLNPLDYLSSNS